MYTDSALPIFPILVNTFPNVTKFELYLHSPVYRKVLPVVLPGWPHRESLKLTLPISIPFGADHPLLFLIASEEAPADPASGTPHLRTLEMLAYEVPQLLNLLEHLQNTPTRHSLERAYLVLSLNIRDGVDVNSEYARPFAKLVRITNSFVNLWWTQRYEPFSIVSHWQISKLLASSFFFSTSQHNLASTQLLMLHLLRTKQTSRS
jgi:hypothetical protein